MRILFVQTNTYSMLYPLPIGPALVARRLQRDGHEVEFVDLMGEKDPQAAAAGAARRFRPDLACFSIRNRDNQSMLRPLDPIPGIQAIVRAVREAAPVPAVLGGTAFTTYPARMLDAMGADYGMCGDDLETVARFVRSMAEGRPDLTTPGLVFRDGGGAIVENPFTIVGYRDVVFDHHGLIDRARYRKGYWQAAVVTRTGCPERCAYCDTFHTYGREFRLREPGAIAEEMLQLKRSGTVRSVWLVDAGFNRPLEHAKETLREIIRQGAQLQLYCVFDPGPADREFLQLFRRAGGVMVTLFAESLADPVLEQLDKPFRVAEVVRDTELLRREGIGFFFMPTFGAPGETRDTARETLRRIPTLRALAYQCSIGWRITPRTPLHDRAVAEGVVTADDDCWEAHYYVSPDAPREWLQRELRAFRLRHPLPWWRMIPFAISAWRVRPWEWGPAEA